MPYGTTSCSAPAQSHQDGIAPAIPIVRGDLGLRVTLCLASVSLQDDPRSCLHPWLMPAWRTLVPKGLQSPGGAHTDGGVTPRWHGARREAPLQHTGKSPAAAWATTPTPTLPAHSYLQPGSCQRFLITGTKPETRRQQDRRSPGNHRFTECSGLEGTSVGHPVQPPAEAGSRSVGCRGPCPGGS